MTGDGEIQSHSTLEVHRPETGIEAITIETIRTDPRPSPHDRSLPEVLPELPSPIEMMQQDPGLVVTSSPQVMSFPSMDATSEPSASPDTSPSSEPFTLSVRDEKIPGTQPRQRKICYLKPKYFWITLTVSILVLGAVIGAAVGVTVSKSKKHPSPQDVPLSPPAVSNTTSPGSVLSSQTGLASVAWNDTNGVTQHRVYYQDGARYIRESSWDPESLTWKATPNAIGRSKRNTPIAAAIAASDQYRFQINVYALNGRNHVQQWYTRNGTDWKVGPINGMQKLASASSSLAASWQGHEGCTSCPDTFLLVYQDTHGKFQLGNATIGVEWHWSELQAHPASGNPASGTGISLGLFWWPTAPVGVRLYYQSENLQLCSLDWDASNSNVSNATDLWVPRTNSQWSTLPSRAPIATLTWGTTGKGVPRIFDVLSSGPGGVMINQWAGVRNTWLNTASPAVMQGVQNYTSLATNSNALAYAVLNDTIWEFGLKSNNKRWSPTGKIWP